MRISYRLLLLALVVTVLLLGRNYFGSLQIGASAESVRTFVRDMGWWGPPIFVGMFLFRSVLLMPSVVLLTAGGICFGLIGGAVFGAIGLTFSATMKFLIAHLAGRESLLTRLPASWQARLRTVDRSTSAATLTLITAYPIGPAEIFHIAAILAGMTALPFISAVAIGALVRAIAFSVFGDAIAEGRNLGFSIIVLTAALVAPLTIPGVRRFILKAP